MTNPALGGSAGSTATYELCSRLNHLSTTVDNAFVTFSKLSRTFDLSKKGEYETQKKLLTDCLNEMDDILIKFDGILKEGGALRSSPVVIHYTDISRNFKTMLRSIDADIQEKLERSELLNMTSSPGRNLMKMEHGTNYALAEFESAQRSNNMIDEHIDLLLNARDDLHDQQLLLGRAQSKLYDSNSKYQMMNNLIHRIALRRRRDQYLVGAIIVFGFLGLLMFAR